MWLADQWKDYEVLDTSNGEKLEQLGRLFSGKTRPTGSMGHPKKLSGRSQMDIITEATKAVDSGNSLIFLRHGIFSTKN